MIYIACLIVVLVDQRLIAELGGTRGPKEDNCHPRLDSIYGRAVGWGLGGIIERVFRSSVAGGRGRARHGGFFALGEGPLL